MACCIHPCHDIEWGADQGEEGGVEVDRTVAVQTHVHRHQALQTTGKTYFTTYRRISQCLSPRPNWVHPPPIPQASVSSPPEPKVGEGRQHSPAGKGLGGPNSDDWRESLALYLVYSVPLSIDRKYAVPSSCWLHWWTLEKIDSVTSTSTSKVTELEITSIFQ